MNTRALPFLFSFKGRIGRAQWWVVQLAFAVVYVLNDLILEIDGQSNTYLACVLSMLILMLVGLWVLLAANTKRFHDIGKTGWWQLIAIIPLAGFWIAFVLGFGRGDPDVNRYGSNQGNLGRDQTTAETQ
jgi:uncharacterized membrane protein YhaH (DUF805 family)